jgi:predicted dehydrogenase
MSAPPIPDPRPLPPAPALRWGLMAPGGIAGRFADALHAHSPQRFVAVGSRSAERAGRFAAEHGIERAFGSYEQVAAEPDVDAVYVASPHSAHRDLALLAITAGKHVLIEKPLAASAAEAQVIADAARTAGVMAMEAMWTRYLPQADVIRQLLAAGQVGDVRFVSADFGFAAAFDPAHRLFDPDQAGGVLLDAGVYPVSFASSVLGPASSVTAVGGLAPTGVDCDAALVMDHGDRYSTALTSITSSLPTRATIMGSKGRIDVDAPFFAPGGLTFTAGNAWGPDAQAARWEDRTYADPYSALHYQADALARYAAGGRTESPVHPLDEVVAVLRTIDEARRQLGAR